jgi:hypothetical protein
MRDNGLTRSRNGQSFWKCLKWGLESALREKGDRARKRAIRDKGRDKGTKLKRER